MAKRQLTDEERQARQARLDILAAAAQAIETGDPARVDTVAAILGTYSRRNICLIIAQADARGRDVPGAVAGFHDWRKAGRMVRKGAKGYAIYRPRMVKDIDTGEETRTGYAVTYVFDVLDTDPLQAGDVDTLRAAMLA